jgi:transposase
MLTGPVRFTIISIMYIKKVVKKNKGSTKQFEYLHLVENVRTDKGPRQRLVLNLGSLDISEDKYKELANCIEGLITGQRPLFSPDPEIETHAQKAAKRIIEKRTADLGIEQLAVFHNDEPDYKLVDISSIDSHTIRSIGPEYVCHSVWKELKMDAFLLSNGIPKYYLPLIETLVVGRLVDPGSERHTWFWAENLSAIFELTGKPERFSLSSFYRAADCVFNVKNKIEVHLSVKEKELFSLPETLCLFDLTNTYMEGQASANPKARRGHSKEKRSDCKLLTLAMIVDEQGFAKYSHLYAGNQSEGKTLPEMIESLVKARPDLSTNRTVIMDAGIATADNIKYMKENQFHYIVVSRSKSEFSPDDTEQMTVIHQDDDRNFKLEVVRHEKENEAYLLCRSAGRLLKDKSIRVTQEDLFIDRLEYYKNGLGKKGHTKIYTKIVEMIGRLREKYPRASKLYDVTVVPDQNSSSSNKNHATDITWKKRVEDQLNMDGCYILRTDHMNMTDLEIWKTYVMLTRVESAFRCLKSSLGLRPVYHQIERRTDAHMFVSVLSYHILHIIEQRLRLHGDRRSWETIREVLSTHKRLTIEYNVKEHEQNIRYHLNLCSKPEPTHKEVYYRLGLSGIPLGKRYVAVK